MDVMSITKTTKNSATSHDRVPHLAEKGLYIKRWQMVMS